jgi:hypothetical protein
MAFLMKNDFYSLIYVYSEKEIEATHGTALKAKFGDRIKFKKKDENFTKENIDALKKELLDEIKVWGDTQKNLSVPIQWSIAINTALQKIFKDLSAIDPNWITDVYISAKEDGANPEIFVIEMLQQILSESLVQDDQLGNAIKEE